MRLLIGLILGHFPCKWWDWHEPVQVPSREALGSVKVECLFCRKSLDETLSEPSTGTT